VIGRPTSGLSGRNKPYRANVSNMGYRAINERAS